MGASRGSRYGRPGSVHVSAPADRVLGQGRRKGLGNLGRGLAGRDGAGDRSCAAERPAGGSTPQHRGCVQALRA